MSLARYVTLQGATGHIRRETYDGQEHVVVPVVALVEGVIHAVNSPQPELVRASQFTNLAAWNGRPLFAGHPSRNGKPVSGNSPDVLPESFGRVFNARVDGKRLCMEAWINTAKATAGTAAARILAAVEAGEMVEVSVGVFVNAMKRAGDYNGKRYLAEWEGMVPDHLALLIDGVGACSVAMGCGIRAAAMHIAENGELELVTTEDSVSYPSWENVKNWLRALMPRGWGDDEVKADLKDTLRANDSDFARGGEIVRVTNDAVTYMVFPPMNSLAPYDEVPSKIQHFTRKYSFDNSTKKFSLEERKSVTPTTVYEPTVAEQNDESESEGQSTLKAACGRGGNCTCGCSTHKPATSVVEGEENMERTARIAALVANPHSTVKNIKMLEAASDDDLTALEAAATAAKTTAESLVTATSQIATLQAQVTTLSAQPTEEEALARLPKTLRDQIAETQAQRAAEHAGLVDSLKTAQSAWSEDELKAMDIKQLRKLAVVSKATVTQAQPEINFGGLPVPRAAAAMGDISAFAPPDPYAARAK